MILCEAMITTPTTDRIILICRNNARVRLRSGQDHRNIPRNWSEVFDLRAVLLGAAVLQIFERNPRVLMLNDRDSNGAFCGLRESALRLGHFVGKFGVFLQVFVVSVLVDSRILTGFFDIVVE